MKWALASVTARVLGKKHLFAEVSCCDYIQFMKLF